MQQMYSPMAQAVKSRGRGEDTMLVHMTPNEVNSLQGLAMANGGSLTINPDTGLPEAGFLGKLLPSIIGAALAATGVGAPLAALMVGAGQTALTGDISKGLTAGLGAFGGAGLAGAAGLGGSISQNAFGALGNSGGLFGAANYGAAAAPTVTSEAASEAATQAARQGVTQAAQNLPANLQGFPELVQQAATQGAQNAGAIGANQAINVGAQGLQTTTANTPGFLSRFGKIAQIPGAPDMVNKALPAAAGMGVLSGVAGALSPTAPSPTQPPSEREYAYEGPYQQAQRPVTFYNDILDSSNPAGGLGSTAERMYFPAERPALLNMAGEVVQPGYYNEELQGAPYNYVGMRYAPEDPITRKEAKRRSKLVDPNIYMAAEGGEINMQDGGFVMPARETAEFGNGSTMAGQRRLAEMGGVPIRGRGDGVSDSIPARIDGQQRAAVADGETYFPPRAVNRLGGAKKLQDMMDRATRSRQQASRGGKNKMRGLA